VQVSPPIVDAPEWSPPAVDRAPLISSPPERLFRCAELVDTPALIYDLPGVTATVRRMREDIEVVPGAKLNVALKACHTPAVLGHLAGLGLGCDVASVGELQLAHAAGFTEISATGPAFAVHDFALFRAAGVVPDIDSVSQLDIYGTAFPHGDVGLRVRVPLPEQLQSATTFAADSRFGIDSTDPAVAELLVRHDLRVTRLHAHTGQMTPESLLYKTKYLLVLAGHHRAVHTIDLGGGFFHLYVDRMRAVAAFHRVAEWMTEWRQRHDRELALRFEPGGAILAPYGHLVTEVRAVEDRHPVFDRPVVTVDGSAWNLAPWHKPQAVALFDTTSPAEPVLIAGNTLYENDFFGLGVNGEMHPVELPPPRVGDRVLLTVSGAYTMTNYRRFNRIPPPQEYVFDGQSCVAMTGTPWDHEDGNH
jgi:diaminopimelate decarboxylase